MCGIISGYCREMKLPYGMIYHCLVFLGGKLATLNSFDMYIYRIGLFWYGGLRLSTPQMIQNWQNGLVLCWNARPHLWVPIGAPSWIHILYRRVIQLPQIQRLHWHFFRHMLSPAIHFTFEISSIFTPTAAVDWLRNQRNSRIPLRATKFRSHLAMLPLKARTYTGPRYGAEIWRYGLV